MNFFLGYIKESHPGLVQGFGCSAVDLKRQVIRNIFHKFKAVMRIVYCEARDCDASRKPSTYQAVQLAILDVNL